MYQNRVRSSSIGLCIRKMGRQINSPTICQFELISKQNLFIQVLECMEGVISSNF